MDLDDFIWIIYLHLLLHQTDVYEIKTKGLHETEDSLKICLNHLNEDLGPNTIPLRNYGYC